MKKLSVAIAAGALLASPVFANDYQAELGLVYGQVDTKLDLGPFGSFDDDASSTTLYGEVFFDTVDTSKGPLAEASFLSKSSGLSLSYTTVEDVDDDSWALGGRFVFGNDYIIEAGYSSVEDSTSWGAGFGKYLTDSTDLVVSYSTNDDANLDTLSADMHSVVSLSGDASLAYTLGLSYLDADSETGFGIAGDLTYYFNNNLGIGAGVSQQSFDSVDITTWQVFADWFVTNNLDLGLSYSDTDMEIIETSMIAANASFRF
ncbi:hypothetical protein SAMN02745866_03688 [Alteromonadaceae bacterium Bs31]|nr:hypothetical protein SAMN02745866_03688 [Alteromonadaceae bacterium Bs31]